MKKFVLIILMLVLLTGCSNLDGDIAVDPSSTTEILVTIPSGSSTSTIAETLKEHDLITSINLFKINSKRLEADGKMKAGDYQLSKSMTINAIIQKLVDGDVYIETQTFTIPEGFEVKQIVERLDAEGLVDPEKFISVLENEPFDYAFLEGIDRSNRLEGFLFPDTYTVRKGASEKEIVELMLNRFDQIFKAEYYDRLVEMDMDMNQLITMASIVEREAMLDDERAIIAGVFYNRIDIDMKLESCATVQYILGERKTNLTYDDIAIESPYNTYINAGLPPAPISTVGEKSLLAALYPEESEYLFFVTTENNDGSHYFNETYDGHINSKNKSN